MKEARYKQSRHQMSIVPEANQDVHRSKEIIWKIFFDSKEVPGNKKHDSCFQESLTINCRSIKRKMQLSLKGQLFCPSRT